MSARYRIHVDRTKCMGSGVCVGTAPQFFELDEESLSRPRQEVVAADEVVIDAAECCPTEAITVTDADTGKPAG